MEIASSFTLLHVPYATISTRKPSYAVQDFPPQRSNLFMSSNVSAEKKISAEDNLYMKQAIEAAALGVGNTYPNPAVGCLIVSSDSGKVLGKGFHPKAGYPHAEIFALFEACGYLDSGIEAAEAVVRHTKLGNDSKEDISRVDELLAAYSATDGVKELFEGKLSNEDVTAYVTLEPCCHYGKTPPCAFSLVQAGVNRVVVGFRDPNPRVDGGGCTMLESDGIIVDLMSKDGSKADTKEEVENANACSEIVSAFVNRISPRDDADLIDYSKSMNGAKRSLLRSIAGRRKMDGSMTEFNWPLSAPSVDAKDENVDMEDAVRALPIDHSWMERVDGALWEHELVLLRLTNAVQKKKGAKILGGRIADELGAHVAQVVGHTVLLYRPGRPPVLNLNEIE